MKARRNQNGFTLVEIMVAFLILSIVAAVAGTMLVSSSKFFERNVISDLDKLSADEIHKFVIDRVSSATSVLVADSEVPLAEPYEHYITVRNGRLLFDGGDIYSDSYYHGRRLEMQLQADSAKAQLSLNFLLYENGGTEPVYRTSREVTGAAIKLANIEMASKRPEKLETDTDETTPDPKVYATGKLFWGETDDDGNVSNVPDGIDDYIYFGYTDLEPYDEGGIEIHYPGTINEELRLIADTPMGEGANKGRYIVVNGYFVAVDEDYDEALGFHDPANAEHILAVSDPSYSGIHDKFDPSYFKLNKGDFIQYDGIWYRAMVEFGSEKIDIASSDPTIMSNIWKQIDPPKARGESVYEKGDVVEGTDGKYYMALLPNSLGSNIGQKSVWVEVIDGTFVITENTDGNFDGYWECVNDGYPYNTEKYRLISDGSPYTPPAAP